MLEDMPVEVYRGSLLSTFTDQQIMEEMIERGMKPEQYKKFYAYKYALEQMADYKDDQRP